MVDITETDENEYEIICEDGSEYDLLAEVFETLFNPVGEEGMSERSQTLFEHHFEYS